MKRFLPAAFLPALLALTAHHLLADSWMPFRDLRAVSPSGRTYVVIRNLESGVRYELLRRRDGAPALGPATAADAYGLREGSGGPIDADPEDEVLAKGTLPQLPLEVRVTDRPAGFVAFEKYANVGHGDSVVFVAARRGTVFAKSLDDLFGEGAAARFTASISSIWWYEGFTVDETRGEVVLVAEGDLLREVSLEDGSVTTPSPVVLLGGFRSGHDGERELCLEAASRLKPEGLREAAAALALDEAASPGIRLRGAVAAKRAGANLSLEPLFLKAVEKGNPGGVRKYAAAHLTEMLGAKAMPVLRRLMRGEADNDVWHPCQTAFVSLGEAAVPTLVEMLLEEGESPDYRGGAAHALGQIRSAKALDALLTATATAPEYVANAAVNAAIATGAPDLKERLAEILERGSTQDGRIAMYFRRQPAACAKKALEAALARAEPGSLEERTIREALEALRD